jgi:glucose-6-phosphate isomerase
VAYPAINNFQEIVNKTENRPALHVALRYPKDGKIMVGGENVVTKIHDVLGRVKAFTERVRTSEFTGYTGKSLTDLVVIGIGGSYLSLDFVYEALRFHPEGQKLAAGRRIRFLANVDPIDVTKALEGLNHETTLFLVNSKSFTTAETMLNARTCRQWLWDQYSDHTDVFDGDYDDKACQKLKNEISSSHIVANSCKPELCETFGIAGDNVFEFWDWVGGRYSVASTIGMLPLSLHFGFDFMEKFLKGLHQMDMVLLNEKDLKKNIPLLFGVLGWYNISVEGYGTRALLPYC